MRRLLIVLSMLSLVTCLFAQDDFDATTAEWTAFTKPEWGYGGSFDATTGVFSMDPSQTDSPAYFKAPWNIGNYNFNLYFHIKATEDIGLGDSPRIEIFVSDQPEVAGFDAGYLDGIENGVMGGRYIGVQYQGYPKLRSKSWDWLNDPTSGYNNNAHTSTLRAEGKELALKFDGGDYNEAYCILRQTGPIRGQLELYRDADYTDLLDIITSDNIYQRKTGKDNMVCVDAWRDWCNRVQQSWSMGYVEVMFKGSTGGCKGTIDEMYGEVVWPMDDFYAADAEWTEYPDERGHASYDATTGVFTLDTNGSATGYSFVAPIDVGYNCFELSFTMRPGPNGTFPTFICNVNTATPEELEGHPCDDPGIEDWPGQIHWFGVQYNGEKLNNYGRFKEPYDTPETFNPRPFYDKMSYSLEANGETQAFVVIKRATSDSIYMGWFRDPDYTDVIAEKTYHLIGLDANRGSGLTRMTEETFRMASDSLVTGAPGGSWDITTLVDTTDANWPFVSGSIQDFVQEQHGKFIDQMDYKSVQLTFKIQNSATEGTVEDLMIRQIAPGGGDYAEFSGETAVVERSGAAPAGYALDQNYPNPFNPSTTVSYSIAARENVKLEIYNILGQKVRTLVNKVQAAGSYHILWNGADDNGMLLNSGVYYYRLTAGNFTQSNKMVFVK